LCTHGAPVRPRVFCRADDREPQQKVSRKSNQQLAISSQPSRSFYFVLGSCGEDVIHNMLQKTKNQVQRTKYKEPNTKLYN
jgi:hypothetical protein